MLRNLPTATYQEINQSAVPPELLNGSHAVILPTLFGPALPVAVSTVEQLLFYFGGPDAVRSPLFAQMRRAVARGTKLMIQRLVATGALAATHDYGVVKKVIITAKDLGTWANGILGIDYIPANAGAGQLATLTVRYAPNLGVQEVWTGVDFPTLIANVNAGSIRIQITTTVGFVELDATAGVTVFLAGGTDGAFANQAATDAAVLAILANFNNLTGIDTIAAPGCYSLATLTNLNTYAVNRADLMAVYEIDPSMSAAAALAFAQTINFKSSYTAVYFGSKLLAFSPEDGVDVQGPVILDVQAVFSFSDTVSGNRYRAPAGGKRGLIPNVKTFVTNLLSPANVVLANQLVGAGVNIVGSHPQFGPVVWGAITLNQDGSSLDQIHARRILIDLRQQLAVVFQAELFDPMDPITWRQAYGQAKAILNRLVGDRAIYIGYVYNGDQEASTIQDVRFNKPNDLAAGLYKVQISLVIVGFIQQITFTVQINNLLSLFQTTAVQL